MRVTTSLFVCCLGLVLGCRHARYVEGHGDAGQFMLQRAIAYGARPVATNGLPVLGREWRYIQDEHGLGLLFPGSRYAEVQAFLTSVFGSQPNTAGWGVRQIGAAIYLQTNSASTLVGVHPPHLRLQK